MVRTQSWAQALTLGVALLALASTARAQTVETPDAMIERALDMRDAGNDVEAHELIQRAYGLSATPRNAAQLGLVEQAVGLFVLAEQHLVQALAATDDAWIRRRRTRLQQSLELVRQRLGSVELLTNVPGAAISVGGEVIGTTPFVAPVRVQIGTVPVEVSLDGYRTQSVTLVVTANTLSRQTVRLVANAPQAQLTVAAEVPAVDAHPRVLESPTEHPALQHPEQVDRSTPVEPAESGSIASAWWFWTIIGVAVAGGSVGLAIALSSDTTTNAPLIPGDEPVGGIIQTLSLPAW